MMEALNTLNTLLDMKAKAFTVRELITLMRLDDKTYSIVFCKEELQKIYNRVKNLPMEQGGIEGGYQF